MLSTLHTVHNLRHFNECVFGPPYCECETGLCDEFKPEQTSKLLSREAPAGTQGKGRACQEWAVNVTQTIPHTRQGPKSRCCSQSRRKGI